jgi:hypothetical protein
MVRRFEPGRDRVTLYRLDRSAAEFYDAAAPASLERLQDLLVRELEDRPARSGTRPAEFWQAAADRADRARSPLVVLLLTDGGNDDRTPDGLAALREAVERLARNPRVRRVCVWGVLPGQRAEVRADLAPLGDRLEVRGLEDVDPDRTLAELR